MPRKQGRHERAAPLGASQLAQDKEKQDNVGGVEKQISQMMPTRLGAVEAVIDHVRNPGDRMPIARMIGLEGPGQTVAGDAMLDGGIINNVIRIVVIDEVEMGRRPVQRQGDEGKQKTDQHGASFIRHGRILTAYSQRQKAKTKGPTVELGRTAALLNRLQAA